VAQPNTTTGRPLAARTELFNRDAVACPDPDPDPGAPLAPQQSPPRLVLINGSTVNTVTGEVLSPPG
jgi:hypothetical protein